MTLEMKLIWLDAVRTRVHRVLARCKGHLHVSQIRHLAVLLGHAMDSILGSGRPFNCPSSNRTAGIRLL